MKDEQAIAAKKAALEKKFEAALLELAERKGKLNLEDPGMSSEEMREKIRSDDHVSKGLFQALDEALLRDLAKVRRG